MRRYTFYLSVALFAFWIGSFVVFDLYFKRVEQSGSAQTTETDKSENKEQNSTQQILQDYDDAVDEDEALFKVMEPTIRKWLRGEKIKEGSNNITAELIKEVTGKDESELSNKELHFWKDLGFQFTAYLIDVDDDGKNELAIRNRCAPVGNCKFLIFKKNENGYETILQTSDGTVQTFKLKNSKTNGYFDLETKAHGDAWSGGIEVYKFDGKQYKVSECYEYNYSYLKDGKFHELKKPKIKQRKCDE